MDPGWPDRPDDLVALQRELAEVRPDHWHPGPGPALVAGCWVCFPRGVAGPGDAGDPGWAAAVVLRSGVCVAEQVAVGAAGAPYRPGLFALRAGPLMERTVRGLGVRPDVLMVDATGRDHPRGAGLALHLGAVLDLPTVGVTHRPLLAEGEGPSGSRGATSALRVDGVEVARWVVTRRGTRPLVVHPGWAVDLPTAVALVLAATERHRTPEPLRRARQAARHARAAALREGSGRSNPVTGRVERP